MLFCSMENIKEDALKILEVFKGKSCSEIVAILNEAKILLAERTIYNG